MVENGYTILPVLEDEAPVGLVTKWGVLRAGLDPHP